MFGLGLVELFVLLLAVGLPLAGAIDAAQKPDSAFRVAGQSRTLWIVLQVVGIFFCGVGPIAAGIYFFVIRPKVTVAGP
jgi:hypothetical protein